MQRLKVSGQYKTLMKLFNKGHNSRMPRKDLWIGIKRNWLQQTDLSQALEIYP